jgi:hypothetical protein
VQQSIRKSTSTKAAQGHQENQATHESRLGFEGAARQDFVDLLRSRGLAFYALSLLDIGGIRAKQRIPLFL